MPRFFLYLEYDGSQFEGWQIQPGVSTVQGELNLALKTICKSEVFVYGSGRTDAGVHASFQVAHADLPQEYEKGKILRSLNALLPAGCKVWDIQLVNNDAHARFDATDRSYVYKVITNPSPLRDHTSWYLNNRLDFNLMCDAAHLITAVTNFETFSKPNPGNIGSTFCKVSLAEWKQISDDEFHFHITANRFLHHMVRYLVGSMIRIGDYKLSLERFNNVLQGIDTDYVHLKAPAKGLCLTHISFPK